MIESRSAAAGELQGERGVRVRRINRDTVVPSQVSVKDLNIKLYSSLTFQCFSFNTTLALVGGKLKVYVLVKLLKFLTGANVKK